MKDIGVHSASAGVLLIADSAILVNRSGVNTVGSARLISGSKAFTISTMVIFFVSFTGLSWFPARFSSSFFCKTEQK